MFRFMLLLWALFQSTGITLLYIRSNSNEKTKQEKKRLVNETMEDQFIGWSKSRIYAAVISKIQSVYS